MYACDCRAGSSIAEGYDMPERCWPGIGTLPCHPGREGIVRVKGAFPVPLRAVRRLGCSGAISDVLEPGEDDGLELAVPSVIECTASSILRRRFCLPRDGESSVRFSSSVITVILGM